MVIPIAAVRKQTYQSRTRKEREGERGGDEGRKECERTLQHLEPNHQPTVVTITPAATHRQFPRSGDSPRDEEQDSGRHGGEGGAVEDARVEVAEETDHGRTDEGDDVGAFKDLVWSRGGLVPFPRFELSRIDGRKGGRGGRLNEHRRERDVRRS
jgi:hypothetical protein